MWIGICEDEKEYRTHLENEARSLVQPCDRITVYANGSELLDDIYSAAVPMDLLLLDIEMPAISGIEAALELQKTSPDTQIVIITKHRNFALKSFVIRPSNYLVKPVAIPQLETEIARARRIAGEAVGETLFINAKDSNAYVPLKEILYIESFKEKITVYSVKGTYKFTSKISLLNEQLAGKGFCCIHKSILVNLRHVVSVDRSNRDALLISGKALPISELRITEVLAEYSRYWHSMAPMNTAPAYTGAVRGTHSISRSLAGTLG